MPMFEYIYFICYIFVIYVHHLRNKMPILCDKIYNIFVSVMFGVDLEAHTHQCECTTKFHANFTQMKNINIYIYILLYT